MTYTLTHLSNYRMWYQGLVWPCVGMWRRKILPLVLAKIESLSPRVSTECANNSKKIIDNREEENKFWSVKVEERKKYEYDD